jgi:S1-C subfamily serine protease
VTPAQAADLGKSIGEGVLITMVAIAGPGDRAGIRPLDVVFEVDGAKVKNFSHFSLLLDGISPGTKTALVLLRRQKVSSAYPEQYAWNPLAVEMEAK